MKAAELLTVKNVSKVFAVESGVLRRRTGSVFALRDVSLSLEKGSVLGILGESGSGKTTLGKICCRLLDPDSGEVRIDGKDITSYSRAGLSRKVQMVFQDPFASLNPKLTVGTILAEATDLPSKEARRAKMHETLSTVDLPGDILSSYPHQFSGGQRQRIAIARALLKNPEIIVADEPLSALDISIQDQLLELFKKLKGAHRISFLFISHDIVVTANLADYLIVMKDGIIVEQGKTTEVIAHPRTDYTRRLLEAVPAIERQ